MQLRLLATFVGLAAGAQLAHFTPSHTLYCEGAECRVLETAGADIVVGDALALPPSACDTAAYHGQSHVEALDATTAFACGTRLVRDGLTLRLAPAASSNGGLLSLTTTATGLATTLLATAAAVSVRQQRAIPAMPATVGPSASSGRGLLAGTTALLLAFAPLANGQTAQDDPLGIEQQPPSDTFLNYTCSDGGMMIYPVLSSGQRVFYFGRGLLVFVQFGKVGSSSLRGLMGHWGSGFRDYSTMYHKALPRGHHVPLTQASLAQGKYGLCNMLWQQLPYKPCTYFTLLRHPVARLKSSYDYFCKGCAERRRYCDNRQLESRSGLRCPNMSLIDFAYLEGNMYTYELSGAYACGRCNKPAKDDQYHLACDDGALPIREYRMLRAAKAHLEAHVFPLILEELDLRSFHAHLNYSQQVDMKGYRLPHNNPNRATVGGPVTAAEDTQLHNILRLDIQLYAHARQVAQRWAKELASGVDLQNARNP